MIMLPLIVILICFFDIRAMWNKGLKKEIAVFVFLVALTLSYGFYYLLNPKTASLCRNIFDLVGFKY